MNNFFWHEDIAEYPKNNPSFNPDQVYPEYPFCENVSDSPNQVYQMIRSLFISMKLDCENIGKATWNPLGEFIKQGNTVLIKPNLVKHENSANKGRKGMECLVTHPSVIRCILDYVIIALGRTGKIIVADAPVQGCDFERLKKSWGYDKIEKFYRDKGIFISIDDLRDSKVISKGGHLKSEAMTPKYNGKIINLGKHSYFFTSEKKNINYRITNYDYRILNSNHNGAVHKYCISESLLQADVIINIPKPKSHRKAGYTGALKNMIGVNTSKEFLPHHTKGSKYHGGDEYLEKDLFSYTIGRIHDIKDILNKKKIYWSDKTFDSLCKLLLSRKKSSFSEGSWWGNNTIWKTILDINIIALYANKDGKLSRYPQRKIISIGDMICCGEGEGPLLPSPKQVSGILFCDNSVEFDLILVHIMGFDKKKIPLLVNAVEDKRLYKEDDIYINSNKETFCKKIDEVEWDFAFRPSSGWAGMIEK